MEISKKNSGFTVIELIIVLVILGIIAVTAYIKWPGNTLTASAEASTVVDNIRYAQNLAMAKNERHSFVITSSTSYQIQNSSGNPEVLPIGTSTYTFSQGLVFGTRTGILNKITFNGKGVPFSDLTNPASELTAPAIIPLQVGNKTINITIIPETGRVSQ